MKRLSFLVLLFIVHCSLTTAKAQWSQDPNVNLQVSTWGQYPVACTDGDGGVYIRWEANSYTTYQYIQRVNKYGYTWPQPVEVYGTQNGTGFTGKICPDDSNGVIVLFMEWNVSGIDPQYFFNRRVRVNRIDSTGQKLWGEYGVRVSMRDTGQVIREVVPDGQHGCIVAFLVGPDSLYVQRISASGERMWGEEGVFIADLFSNTIYAVSDCRGGIIIEFGAGWFQRIDSTGYTAWAVLSATPYSLIKSDGQGGILMAHNRYYWGEDRIIVNRMSPDGTFWWGNYGITLADSVGDYSEVLSAVQIDDSATVFFWSQVQDIHLDYQAKFQFISASGNLLLDSEGVSPSLVSDDRRYPMGCVKSDSNSVIFLFSDYRNQGTFGEYGQKFSLSGQRLWDSTDAVFTTQLVNNNEIISDMNGGAIKVGARAPLYGVFAHQINMNGEIGSVLTEVRKNDKSYSKVMNLHQNYPNPFNPTTSIHFDLTHDGFVRLTIYNVLGQSVKTLSNGYRAAGLHTLVWDGTNESDSPVASGLYIYELQSGNQRISRKMLLIR